MAKTRLHIVPDSKPHTSHPPLVSQGMLKGSTDLFPRQSRILGRGEGMEEEGKNHLAPRNEALLCSCISVLAMKVWCNSKRKEVKGKVNKCEYIKLKSFTMEKRQ